MVKLVAGEDWFVDAFAKLFLKQLVSFHFEADGLYSPISIEVSNNLKAGNPFRRIANNHHQTLLYLEGKFPLF